MAYSDIYRKQVELLIQTLISAQNNNVILNQLISDIGLSKITLDCLLKFHYV